MVTVIQPPKKNSKSGNGDARSYQHLGSGTGSGDEGRRAGGGGDGSFLPPPEFDPKPFGYLIGMSLTLLGITLMFAALTITYVSLVGTINWRPIALPSLLWLSTALILTSSVTLEAARRAWRGGAIVKAYRRLSITTLLGAGFIASQLFCWRQLVAQQVYVTSNTHSSFFYLLTGVHALHIIGGIAALCYLLFRMRRASPSANDTRNVRQGSAPDVEDDARLQQLPYAALDAGTLYWHFVDGLWVYVFILLFFWQ